MIQKRFVSENDLEEIRKKREEEWKKAREEGRDVADPDEPVDTRSLYDRLQQQKEAKKEAIEEQLKFKNMIYKGLDEDESAFLSHVADKQAEIDARRFAEDSAELKNYRKAVDELTSEHKQATTQPGKTKSIHNVVKAAAKSQQSLMTGLVRRKRANEDPKLAGTSQDKHPRQEDTSIKQFKVEETKTNFDLQLKDSSSKNALASLANLGDYSSSDSE